MTQSPPRPVAVARLACLAAAVAAFVYIWLAVIELNHLAAGRVSVARELHPFYVYPIADGVRDFTVSAIVLCGVVFVTLLPFSLFTAYARPWTRIVVLLLCLAIVTVAVIITSADGGTLKLGNVIEPGPVNAEEAVRFSRALVAPWFPWTHYAIIAILLAASAATVVALFLSESAEYFRRHQEIPADDPRIWSVSQVRRTESELDRDNESLD